MDTQAAAFLSTYGYAFNAAMPPSPPAANTPKRPILPVDLARSALDTAVANTTTAEHAVSEGESALEAAFHVTPVNPSEITRLSLALRASKVLLQDASTAQAQCQKTYDEEAASDAATKRARLATGRSTPPIVVSFVVLVKSRRSIGNSRDKWRVTLAFLP